MNPAIAQRIAQFMMRITLQPAEIEDFHTCMNALRAIMQPSEVPQEENEDANPQQYPHQAGGQ